MHWTERESFYVYTASHAEHQSGFANKSKRYTSFKEALEVAERMMGRHPDWVNVAIERHTEFWDGYHNEWCIDWKRDGGRQHVWPQ